MYDQLFDKMKQIEMRNYFIDLSKRMGESKSYKKNEIVNYDRSSFVGIVKNGLLAENIVSSKGKIHFLYVLAKGELLDETSYFCGGENVTITIAKEDTDIALIKNEVLTAELSNNPEAYRYFIHSITRKYRIILLHLTSNIFNDSMGKIADALLRLASCADEDPLGRTIVDEVLTHQELANNIGCSRVTVTNCLKELMDKEIISYQNKMIIINEPETLRSFVDLILE